MKENASIMETVTKCDNFIKYLVEEISPEYAYAVAGCLFSALMMRIKVKKLQDGLVERFINELRYTKEENEDREEEK